MKILIYSVVLFVSLSVNSFAQEAIGEKLPPIGNAITGDYYGADISNTVVDKAVSVEKLDAKLKIHKK